VTNREKGQILYLREKRRNTLAAMWGKTPGEKGTAPGRGKDVHPEVLWKGHRETATEKKLIFYSAKKRKPGTNENT